MKTAEDALIFEEITSNLKEQAVTPLTCEVWSDCEVRHKAF
jgi:hypothetical protein